MPIEKEILSDSIHFIFFRLSSFCGFVVELIIDLKDFFLDDLLFLSRQYHSRTDKCFLRLTTPSCP